MATGMFANAISKIANAKPSETGNWIRPGNHVLEVQAMLMKQGHKGTSFIAEFIVIESVGGEDEKGQPVAAHKPGDLVSDVQNLDGAAKDMAPGNIKTLVCHLIGVDPNTVDNAEIESMLGGQDVEEEDPETGKIKKFHIAGFIEPSQPAKGMRIVCNAFNKTSGKGKTYTNKKWTNVVQTNEEIAARRKAQESGQRAA